VLGGYGGRLSLGQSGFDSDWDRITSGVSDELGNKRPQMAN